MINPSEYMLVGLGSSSFIMRQEHLVSLSNKGIHAKSGTSKVQFLTLSTLQSFSVAEAPPQLCSVSF